MSAKGIIELTKEVLNINSIVLNNTTEGTPAAGVDMIGYNALMFIANIGTSGDTLSGSVYLELEVQHSIDDSTWVAATDAMISSSVTGTNTGTFAKIVLAGDTQNYTVGVLDPTEFQYWRVLVRATGTHTNGTPLGVVALKGHPDTLPAA